MSKTSGIYVIQNKANGKLYVGSSVSVRYRWRQQHRTELRRGIHYNSHLQRAWNKYGEANFEFIILEECSEDLLVEREGYWIEHHKSWDRDHGYNLNRYVDGRMILSEETRQLMSEATKQSWQDPDIRTKRCEAIKNSVTDKIRESLSEARRQDYEDPEYRAERSKTMTDTWKEQSEELKAKLKAAWTKPEVRQRHEHTTINKKKMSKASKEWWAENARPILQLTLDGQLIREWPSPTAAIKEYGSHVSSVLNGKRSHCRGYVWRYK